MRRFGFGLIGLAAVLGCGAEPDGGAVEPLRIAAASDLQSALPALIERFRRENKVEVVPTFGASGQLAQQIEQGAPFDLFLSANREFVQGLADKGIVRPESVRPYAIGSLVLVVDTRSGVAVEGLDDLAKPEVKEVALANPDHAPYGLAAKQALERDGLWDGLGPKIVYADSIRQALQFVESGNAEAGLVSEALTRAEHVRVIGVDSKLHEPIVQALGVVAKARRGEEAERFARFLLGDEGQGMLVGYGFKRAGR